MNPTVAVQLALVLCLRAQPDVCQPPLPIVLEQPPTLMECTIWGQQSGAAWLDVHPVLARDYFVRRVNCSFSGMRDGSTG